MDLDDGTSSSADGVQTLNDLQNYLVHFNKEIEVTGENGFQHSVSEIISQTSQPVYVTIPVPSDTSSPIDEELRVIGAMKSEKSNSEDLIPDDLTAEITIGDEVSVKSELDLVPMEGVTSDDQMATIHTSITELDQSDIQALNVESAIPVELIKGISVQSEGIMVIPMNDNSGLMTQDQLVQIVNVGGQPTLQVYGESSALKHEALPEIPAPPAHVVTKSAPVSLTSGIDGGDQVAVLASVAANTSSISQLQGLQLSQQDLSAQLVALRDSADGSQPQLVAVQVDPTAAGDNDNNGQVVVPGPSPSLLNTVTGYQTVAVVPSGDANSTGEISYVLIVNPSTDKASMGSVFDLGDDLEIMDSSGTPRRVKLNKFLTERSLQQMSAIPICAEDMMCNICNYTSPKKTLLARHIKSHSADRPHKCNICERGFKTMASLQNHVNTHTGVRPHKCKMCESAFTTSGELVRHIRYKHTFEKPHKCTECDYASVELSKLKRHIRSHTGERPYACTQCEYASPDTYKLKRHMRIHTGEKPYECDVCHARFTQSNSLKAHKLIHSGNKPVFQCPMCDATCGRKTDLKIHIQKLHTSEHPLACRKCGCSFPDRYQFKMHMKGHEGEKCFKCGECEYATTSLRHLETHVLTHSGEKPFECGDCDLAFRQKQLLKRHRTLYHGGATYDGDDAGNKESGCDECERAFAHKGSVAPATAPRDDDPEAGVHTCGGWPRDAGIVPYTADQLIENGLLADMKEGKLGQSPKVVVVHPDGRVEEVTQKLQNLSQTKHVDDFLVSLGVSADSQLDHISSIPGIVTDPSYSQTVQQATANKAKITVSVPRVVASHEPDQMLDEQSGNLVISNDNSNAVVNIQVAPTAVEKLYGPTVPVMGALQPGHASYSVVLQQPPGFSGTVETGTQAAFDSDPDDDSQHMGPTGQPTAYVDMDVLGGMKVTPISSGHLPMEAVDIAHIGPSEVMVSVLQDSLDMSLASRLDKRLQDDSRDLSMPAKRIKLVVTDS